MERALLQGEREAERALLQQEQRAAEQLQEKLVALETGVQKERDKVTAPAALGAGPAWERGETPLGPLTPPPSSRLQTRRPRGASGRKVAARRSPRAGLVTLVWASGWVSAVLGACVLGLLGSTQAPAGQGAQGGLVLGACRLGPCGEGLQQAASEGRRWSPGEPSGLCSPEPPGSPAPSLPLSGLVPACRDRSIPEGHASHTQEGLP